MSIRDVVAGAPFLAGLPDDDLDALAAVARPVHWPAGTAIFREGEAARQCWLLTAGQVSLEIHAAGRGGLIVGTLGPGQLLGWSWLYPPHRWHLDAVATAPTDALAFDADALRARAEADPNFGTELHRRVAGVVVERLQTTRLQLADLYGPAPAPGPARPTGDGGR